ncbi:hypothetical protein [Jeotgalibaca caeni]|uniref:hypothetical protein n=1 Tax=Jeotgalibaca caeni TaxID=3028623 RepID=UPI00237E7994|nr:hypothetical protein [Jeotgalibaca caeni]MDE1548538.1 hypothetical protein [Jeotgalibaca caeni]
MNLNRIWLGVLLGILFLLMGGSLVYTTLENQALKKAVAETQDVTHEAVQEEGLPPVGEEAAQTTVSGKALFVAGVFQRFLPYNEKTYLSRFEEVEGKVTDEVLAALKGMVATIDPAIPVQNTLHDLEVYTNGTNKNQFLVIATVSLQVGEGVDSTYTQVYQTTLEEEGASYRINRIDSLGGIAPFDRE